MISAGSLRLLRRGPADFHVEVAGLKLATRKCHAVVPQCAAGLNSARNHIRWSKERGVHVGINVLRACDTVLRRD
jgi:hypothetical protein